MNFTEEELDILRNWGFIASTERPLSEEEKALYFKITDEPKTKRETLKLKYTIKCTQCGAEYESDELMYFCPKC